jgi:hypothetical protein
MCVILLSVFLLADFGTALKNGIRIPFFERLGKRFKVASDILLFRKHKLHTTNIACDGDGVLNGAFWKCHGTIPIA